MISARRKLLPTHTRGTAMGPSAALDVGTQPACESGFVEGSRRKAQHGLRSVFFTRGEAYAVHFQKKGADDETGALVSIDERMIVKDCGGVGGGQLHKVSFVAVRAKLLRASERGLQKPRVAQARRAAVKAE